jgi:hypothetical protein
MELVSERVATEQVAEGTSPLCRSRCPMCSGPLVELRASLRCSRCHFTICEGCAGDPGDNFGAAAD